MTKKREMKSKREFFFILTVLLAGVLFLALSSVDVEGASSYFCAEKTTNEAWCQNVPLGEVDTNYDYTQTSCDATSFCKAGTCVNGIEGSCRPNVPKIVCDDAGGIWDERERDEISQCQLGCCYIGNSASFVTQTKCVSQASRYSVETVFDPSIKDSDKCFASAYPEEEGACVTDDGFVRNCKRSTSAECDAEKAGALEGTTVEFHKGTLCTAAHLETKCIPTERTKLEPERDEVFFIDSCGNTANIYDASKIEDKNGKLIFDQTYWDYMVDKKDSCVLSSENIDSCGNCNYINGNIGKKYERNKDMTEPTYGDFVCADLGCEYDVNGNKKIDENEKFKNGESWCGTTSTGKDFLPGSQQFRFICDYGEIRKEEMDPFRGTICVESEVEGFRTANPRANLWRDCVSQDNQEDCEDVQERDCMWINGTGASILRDEDGNPLVINSDGKLVPIDELEYGDPGVEFGPFGKKITNVIEAACVPKYPSALWFWEPNETKEDLSSENAKNAMDTCSFGNDICIVEFVKGKFFGTWDCSDNCYCLGLEDDAGKHFSERDMENEWVVNNLEVCVALGDCGISENYLEKEGRWTWEDLVEVTELKEEDFENEK